MERIKVLLADDSTVMRIMIKNILEAFEEFEIVGAATNGKDVFHKTTKLKPDVVLTDLYMGEFDGLYAVKKIMEFCPTPILILSSAGNTNLDPILETLKEGAIDYINKPVKHQSRLKEVAEELKEKIIMAYSNKSRIVRHELNKKYNTNPHSFNDDLPFDIITIGSSTGGPTALETILGNIPQNLPVPIVITQHMPEDFVPSFAKRLTHLSKREVTIAKPGTELKSNGIYIVEGGANTVLVRQGDAIKFHHTSMQFEAYNNPSVDGVFNSVADLFGKKTLAVILSGMGSDGVEGITSIKNKGGLTVAQSEETCVVYGMPKRANQAGVIDYNIHLKEIAPFLMSAIS